MLMCTLLAQSNKDYVAGGAETNVLARCSQSVRCDDGDVIVGEVKPREETLAVARVYHRGI